MSLWDTVPYSLRQLQYLVAVADLGGFRRAADACGVAQPSLSAQVAQVESALGVADRAYVLNHGDLVLQGTAAQVRADAHVLESSYLGTAAL